jgi:ribosomal protein S18 acetylase RimI-like enzyme
MMKIRPYKSKDKEQILRLWRENFSYYNAKHNSPERSLTLKSKQKDGLLLVADAGKDGLIGTVLAGFDGHRGWIYSLAVTSSYRQKGTGSILLKHAEKLLKKLGAPKINLQVMPDNKGVIEFYTKNGYNVEERTSLGKRLIK